MSKTFLVQSDDKADGFFRAALDAGTVSVNGEYGPNGDHINRWGVSSLPCLVEVSGDDVVFVATTYEQVTNYAKALKAHKATVAAEAKAEAQRIADEEAAAQAVLDAIEAEAEAAAQAQVDEIAELKERLAKLEAGK